jgi:hypothetical protein
VIPKVAVAAGVGLISAVLALMMEPATVAETRDPALDRILDTAVLDIAVWPQAAADSPAVSMTNNMSVADTAGRILVPRGRCRDREVLPVLR